MKISNLKLNPQNPRIIKDDKFKKLMQSINDFPEMMEKRPMVCVTDEDGKIYPLGGNMRLKAIIELGYKEIPDNWIMIADNWTEEQRKEFIIKDNVSFGEWNFEELTLNWKIEQLESWGVDMPEFVKILNEVTEDEFDEPIDDIITDIQEGDLFKIGNHYLLCGDAFNSDYCEKLLQNKKASCIITDPPFETVFNYSNTLLFSENCHIFIFNNDRAIIEQLKKSPFKFKKFFIFNHSGCAIPQEGGNECFLDHILISHEINGNPKIRFNKGDGLRTVIRGEYRKSKNHKHEKPANLLCDLLRGYSDEESIVLDFFGGSGSLMAACEQLNRNCYTMELNPIMCQVIINRMEKCYNLKAEKQ